MIEKWRGGLADGTCSIMLWSETAAAQWSGLREPERQERPENGWIDWRLASGDEPVEVVAALEVTGLSLADLNQLIEMRKGAVPCLLHALLTPRGSVTFRENESVPEIFILESHPVAHLYHSKAADGGITNPKGEIHIPSRRRQRHERLRQACCNTGTAIIPGHSIEPSPRPHPWHDHPSHLLCLSGFRAICSGQFLSSRRGCRIGASQRTKVEAHTNQALFCSVARSS